MYSNKFSKKIEQNVESRIAIIDKDKCKPKKCQKQCKSKCPVNIMGKICIEIEDIAKIHEDMCISCGICVKVCPFNAIRMVKIPSQIKNNLVHSYGENLFKLYKLPMPKSGHIIGILGPNGCGKTTIMNILSRHILPNYGNEDVQLNENDILKNVRGNELQKYLSLLYSKQLKVIVKPQDILSLITKLPNQKLKVCDILNKCQHHVNYDHIIKTLELNKLLDNEIIQLSGGELQKFVCAINLLKNGNVYMFDEPTNYLDIEYRIKVANLIKNLSNENNYIFVVEHDLAILDFIADYIHLMYGEPSAYGVVSTLYNTSDGINMYFDGYIPADNIRFRQEPFKLLEHNLEIESDQIYSDVNGIVNCDETIIKYEHFHLKINQIQLDNKINMVIILGKNGSGKSTFVNTFKNISGLVTSHKQQLNIMDYLDNKITVKDLLFSEIKDAALSPMFVSDVIKLLNIHVLYDKKVKKLSGGELQRLNICLCLGKPANIYLLDEPSASLDVEQRFIVTKVIKRFLLHNHKIGFIVEHDILMAISMAKEASSKILVFEETKYEDNIRYCETSLLLDFHTGINKFLKSINTTFRTDRTNNRPRINKLNSVIDREQKENNKYYL